MITGAVLALLRLNGLVIHMHIVLHRRHVLVSQQLLQAEGVVAQYQVADGEGMTEDVGIDAFVRNPGAFTQARKEQGHSVLGERGARFGEKQVILTSATPVGQLLSIWPLLVQIVQEVAQAVLAERDAPLLGAFPRDGEDAALAVEIRDAQPVQLGDTDAGVIEHPEDGPVAGGGAFGNGTRFVGRRAGDQKLLELLGLNGLDERLADFGKGDAVKGVVLEDFTADQPMEEGASGARIGLNGAFGARFAVAARALAHGSKPGVDIGGVDLAHQSDLALLFQVGAHQVEGRAMPLQGLGAVVAAFVIEQVVPYGPRDGGMRAAFRLQPLLRWLLAA